ncbi:hypothetical protein HYU14_07305 [Candidatus Woesearchaeota archaeon]|nr:hypothetical protein [Candidatus Woesearchaeota archaeon]
MLQKIKDLMQMKSVVDELSAKLESHSKAIDGFKGSFLAAQQEMGSVRSSNQDFLAALQGDLQSLSATKEAFRKELYDFKLLKSQMQESIQKKFEEELAGELKGSTQELRQGIGEFAKVKEQLQSVAKDVQSLASEIAKLKEISKEVKRDDFELTKFLHLVRQGDAEKLELMQKIDALERLVAKMRRRP